jgi:hypothetical protein
VNNNTRIPNVCKIKTAYSAGKKQKLPADYFSALAVKDDQVVIREFCSMGFYFL